MYLLLYYLFIQQNSLIISYYLYDDLTKIELSVNYNRYHVSLRIFIRSLIGIIRL